MTEASRNAAFVEVDCCPLPLIASCAHWNVFVQTHGYASRVQFRLACSKIPKDVLLLEIGPHALMRSPLRQNRSDLQYVATMKKGESAVETLSAAVADLWRKGAIFSWPASAAPSAGAHPERECEEAPFTPCPLRF